MKIIRDHLTGFLIGGFTATIITVSAWSNPWSLGSLFTDIGGGIYKLIGTNIKDGTIGSPQVGFNYAGSTYKWGPANSVGFNGGLTTTSTPTFEGIISTNKSEFGNTTSDYLPSGGNWKYTLQLNGNNNTSIGFHDAGASVSSIKYWPTGFEIGGNDGWGVKQVSIPWGIKFSDGTVQTSAPTIPTKVSQLVNDSGYLTVADISELICMRKHGTPVDGRCRFIGAVRYLFNCSAIAINNVYIGETSCDTPWDTINLLCRRDFIAQKLWFSHGILVGTETKKWLAWPTGWCGGGNLGATFTIDLY